MSRMQVVSNSAVKRAGSNIRRFGRGEASEEDFLAAAEVVRRYRSLYVSPMEAVNTRLLTLAPLVDREVEISSRLKRWVTIVDKLRREPTMNLLLMQDIGGCRAVVTDLSRMMRLRDQIAEDWDGDLADEYDYVKQPRQSGYRAIHLIVVQDGRKVEIQLRTRQMHMWALSVEAFSSVLGDNFKQDGDHIVQRYMRAYSDFIWADEAGVEVASETVAILRELLPDIRSLIEGKAPQSAQEG